MAEFSFKEAKGGVPAPKGNSFSFAEAKGGVPAPKGNSFSFAEAVGGIVEPDVTSPYEGVEGTPIPPQFLRPDLDVGNIRETVAELPKREETTEVAVVDVPEPVVRQNVNPKGNRDNWLNPSPPPRQGHSDRRAQEFPVPVEPAPVIAQETPSSDGYVTKELIDSLIMAESSNDPNAVSPAGAQGLGQIMPRTAKNPGFGIEPLKDPFDPVENRSFTTKYLGALAQRYDGDLEVALVAYNAGLTNADRFLAAGRDYSVLPQRGETEPYVAKVLANVAAPAAPPVAEPPEERSDFIDASKGTWNLLTNVAPKTLGLFNEALVAEGYTERAEGYAAVDQGLSDKELKEKFGDSALAVDRGGRGEVGWLKLYQLATPERRAQLMADHHAGVENVTQRILGKIPALTAAQQKGEQYAPRVAGVTDIKEWGDFVDWLQYNVTAGAIQLAPVMGAAFVAGPVGAGAVGTALATSEAISARLEFINEVVKDLSVEDQAKAITKYLQDTQDTTAMVGLVSGLLDLSGPVYSIVRRNVVKELGEEVVERTLKEVAKQSAIRGAGEVGQEFITGGAQELVQEIGELAEGEQGQGATLFSVENLKRILNAAAAEAAGSFGVSTAGVGVSVGSAALQNKTAANNTELQAAVQTEIVRLRELPENADKTDAQIEALAVEGIVQNAPQELAKIQIKEALPDLSDAELNRLAALPPEQMRAEVLTKINEAVPEGDGSTLADVTEAEADTSSDVAAPARPLSGLVPELEAEIAGMAEQYLENNDNFIFDTDIAEDKAAIEGRYGEQAATFYEAIINEQGTLPADVGRDTPPAPAQSDFDDFSDEAQVAQMKEQLQPKGKQDQGRPVGSPLTSDQQQEATRAKNKEASQLRRQTKKDLKALNESPDSVWGSRNTPTKEEYNTVTQRLADAKELMDAGVASQDVIAQQAADRTQLNVWDQNLKAQETNLSNKRSDAIVSALEISQNPRNQTKPAVLKRAQEALANPSITKAEFQRAQEIIREKEQASNARAVEISESTNSEPNPAILDAPDLMSIVDSIIANGNQFEKALMRLIKPFLKNTQLVIVNNENTDVPASLAADFKGALGLYVDATNTIYLNAVGGTNNTVALHEALHAATVHVLASVISNPKAASPKLRIIVEEIKQLMAVAADKYEMDKNAGRTTLAMDKLAGEDISVFTDIVEFVAYGLSQPELQEFLSTVDATLTWRVGTIRNGLSKFLDLVRQIFNVADKDYSAFIALADLTEKLLIESALYERIPSSDIAKANKVGRKATQIAKKVAESNPKNLQAAIEEQSRAAQNGDQAVKLLDNTRQLLKPSSIRFIAGMMSTSTILKQKGGEIKNLYAMNEVIRDVTRYKQKFLRNVEKEAKKWGEFNYKFKKGAIILADVMHFATLHQFDPSRHTDMAAALLNDKRLNERRANFKSISADPTASRGSINSARGQVTARENVIKEVYEGTTVEGVLVGGWNRLQEKENGGQEGVRIYKMAHQTYKDNLAEFQTLTLEEVKSRQLKPKDEEVLVEKLEKMFSDAKKMEVYFPLMRYGEFYAAIKKAGQDGKGPPNRIFRTFKTMKQRDDYLDDIVTKHWGDKNQLDSLLSDGSGPNPKSTIEKGNTQDSTAKVVRDSLATDGLLKDIFDALDTTGGQAQANLDIDALKDSVYQMYIQALPSADLRKGFVHRKGIAGFSNDVLRNFVTSQVKRANQLARLKYNGALRRATDNAYAELKSSVWEERNKVWVGAFERRTQSILNPKADNPIAHLIQATGSLAVFYYMLSTPASAVVNAIQLHAVGMSVLARDFGSIKTRAVAARYTATLFNKFGLETGQPSMRRSSYFANNPDREFFEQAYDYADELNAFNETYAADLTKRGKISIDEAVADDAGAPEQFVAGAKKMWAGFLSLSSALFHHSERVTREIMFMSGFELSFAKFKKEGMAPEAAAEAAKRQAYDLMMEALFDYSSYNKPPYFRTFVVPTQFLTYPFAMVNLLTRNTIGIVAGMPNGRTRRDAAKLLFGILGRTFLYAGATGLGLGLISFTQVLSYMGLLRDELRPDFDDADEEEKDFWYRGVESDYSNPFSMVDLEFWFRNYFVPEYFGYESNLAAFLNLTEPQADLLARSIEVGPISALTDLNISPRVSLDKLLFRDDTRRPDPQDWAEGLVFKGTGPFGGLVVSGGEAVFNDIPEEEYLRAAQKLSFGIVRAPLKAYEYKTKGWIPKQEFIARDGYGPAFWTWQKVMSQAIGFSSSEQATERDFIYQYNTMRYEIEDARAKQMKAAKDAEIDFLFAIKNHNDSLLELNVAKSERAELGVEATRFKVAEARADVLQFNMMYPADEITDAALEKAIEVGFTEALDINRGILIDEDTTPASQFNLMNRGDAGEELEMRLELEELRRQANPPN